MEPLLTEPLLVKLLNMLWKSVQFVTKFSEFQILEEEEFDIGLLVDLWNWICVVDVRLVLLIFVWFVAISWSDFDARRKEKTWINLAHLTARQ